MADLLGLSSLPVAAWQVWRMRRLNWTKFEDGIDIESTGRLVGASGDV